MVEILHKPAFRPTLKCPAGHTQNYTSFCSVVLYSI